MKKPEFFAWVAVLIAGSMAWGYLLALVVHGVIGR